MNCNICYLPIQGQTAHERCPRCFNDFHKDHFAAWLLSHDYCPMCRNPLSLEFRNTLKPKTKQDRIRLEQTLSRLDGLGDVFRQLESKQKKRIMQAREQEFGLDGKSWRDYIGLAVPVFFFSLFFIFIIAALVS